MQNTGLRFGGRAGSSCLSASRPTRETATGGHPVRASSVEIGQMGQFLPRRLPRSTEEQDIAVGVANFEAAQAVVGIFERDAEGCSITGKFGGEGIGVGGIDEGIPPHVGMAFGVRQRGHIFFGLDEDLRSVAADDGGKRVSIRLLPSRLKAKLVAVKSDGLLDIGDDEER